MFPNANSNEDRHQVCDQVVMYSARCPVHSDHSLNIRELKNNIFKIWYCSADGEGEGGGEGWRRGRVCGWEYT